MAYELFIGATGSLIAMLLAYLAVGPLVRALRFARAYPRLLHAERLRSAQLERALQEARTALLRFNPAGLDCDIEAIRRDVNTRRQFALPQPEVCRRDAAANMVCIGRGSDAGVVPGMRVSVFSPSLRRGEEYVFRAQDIDRARAYVWLERVSLRELADPYLVVSFVTAHALNPIEDKVAFLLHLIESSLASAGSSE